MNNKNILLAVAVLIAGQTYGAQPLNDLTTVAGVRAHVTGQRVQAENDAVQALQNAELNRRNNLTTFSRVAEDIVINPITACGSMLYGGIKNVGFYSYHFLKYPLISLGFVAAGRSVGTALHKEITDETFNKVLLGGAAAGAIFAVYQAPKDIAKVQQFKDLQKNNRDLEADLDAAALLAAAYANTHGNLERIQQQLTGQKADLDALKKQQGDIATAIKDEGKKLDAVKDQLVLHSADLSGIQRQGLMLIEGQFVTALQGLLNSAASLHNSYIAIQGLSECDNNREMSIQMFTCNLTALNGFTQQAMRTLAELKLTYPELYKKLHHGNVDSITAPLTRSLQWLNQSGARYFALDQAPARQQALENRLQQDAQLRLMAASSSSSSSSITNTVSTTPVIISNVTNITRDSHSLMMRSGQLLVSSRPASSDQSIISMDGVD